MQPPDLSQMPGSSAGKPMYILDAAPDRVRKVEIVGGKVEAEIVNKSIPVTLGGERVEVLVTNDSLSVRLQSGEVVPVYVEGGFCKCEPVTR